MNGFKEGDYIVILKAKTLNWENDEDFPINYCYKQEINYTYLYVEKDAIGHRNGWMIHPFDRSQNNDWRYAKPHEIEHYDIIGKPYNVTQLELCHIDHLEKEDYSHLIYILKKLNIR